jgi:hypothetical protein
VIEATCDHPVAEATVFSKQRARRRGAAIHEYEFEAAVRTGSGQVAEYQFDGTGLRR